MISKETNYAEIVIKSWGRIKIDVCASSHTSITRCSGDPITTMILQ